MSSGNRYVITTDSRKKDEVLFMVDRNKQKKSFWSNRLDDVFIFNDLSAAKRVCDGYKYNNPRVLTLNDASKISSYSKEVRQAQPWELEEDDSWLSGWDEGGTWDDDSYCEEIK